MLHDFTLLTENVSPTSICDLFIDAITPTKPNEEVKLNCSLEAEPL